MNVHRDDPPRNPWLGLLNLTVLCVTAIIITFLVTA